MVNENIKKKGITLTEEQKRNVEFLDNIISRAKEIHIIAAAIGH